MTDKKNYLIKPPASETTIMTAFSKEKVRNVTFNTNNFDPLIHPSIQRHNDYD